MRSILLRCCLALAVAAAWCGAARSAEDAAAWGTLEAFREFPGNAKSANRAIRDGWPKADSKLRKAVLSSGAELEAARRADWEVFFRPNTPASADDPKARVFVQTQNLTRLLLLGGRMKMNDGNPTGAWTDYYAAARLSQAVLYQNSLVSFATSIRLKLLLYRPLADFLKSQGIREEQKQAFASLLRKNPPGPEALAAALRVEKTVAIAVVRAGLLSFKPSLPVSGEDTVEGFNKAAADRAGELVGAYFERMADAVRRSSTKDMRAIRAEIVEMQEALDRRFSRYDKPETLVTAYLRHPDWFAGEDIPELVARRLVPLAVPDVEAVYAEAVEVSEKYGGLFGGGGV